MPEQEDYAEPGDSEKKKTLKRVPNKKGEDGGKK